MAFEHPVTLADIPAEIYGKDIYSPSPTALPRIHIGSAGIEWVDSSGITHAITGGSGNLGDMLFNRVSTALAGDIDVHILELLRRGERYRNNTGTSATTTSTEIVCFETGSISVQNDRVLEIEIDAYFQIPQNQNIQVICRYTQANGPTAPNISTTSTILNSYIFPGSGGSAGIIRCNGKHRMTISGFGLGSGSINFGYTLKNISASPGNTFLSPQGPGQVTVTDIGTGQSI